MMPTKHTFLFASASHRWLNCPPSAKLCESLPNQTSSFTQEGSDCHEICAYLVEKTLGKQVTDPTENLTYYNAEMQNWVENGFGTGNCLILADQEQIIDYKHGLVY